MQNKHKYNVHEDTLSIDKHDKQTKKEINKQTKKEIHKKLYLWFCKCSVPGALFIDFDDVPNMCCFFPSMS